MRVWTLIELFRLTRAELFALHQDIVQTLKVMPDGDPDRRVALDNLANIRRVLARPNLAPR